MIAPELRPESADPSWVEGHRRHLDFSPPGYPSTMPPSAAMEYFSAAMGSSAGAGAAGWAQSLREGIDQAASRYPWGVVTAGAIVGIAAGWLAKRR